MERECRQVEFTELRIAREEGKPPRLVGHSAVFNKPTIIGQWFEEVIEPGAFADSIKADDIRCLFNHDANYVLGRTSSETLTLREDDEGLWMENELPDTGFARDLEVSINRGDITGQSFSFEIENYQQDQEWVDRHKEGKLPLRKLKKLALFDVGPVTFPAYEQTDVAVRELRSWEATQGEPAESRPYPNEHACRLRAPGDFEKDSFRRIKRKHDGKEYSVIVGRLKGEDTTTEQAYRYKKDTWSASAARTHCKDHDGSFEAAQDAKAKRARAIKIHEELDARAAEASPEGWK